MIELKLPDRGRYFRAVNRIVAFIMLVTSIVTFVGLFSLRDTLVHINIGTLKSPLDRANEVAGLRSADMQNILINAADRIIDSRGKVVVYACGAKAIAVEGMKTGNGARSIDGCIGLVPNAVIMPGQILKVQPAEGVTFLSGEHKVMAAPLVVGGLRLAYLVIASVALLMALLSGIALFFWDENGPRGAVLVGSVIVSALLPFLISYGSVSSGTLMLHAFIMIAGLTPLILSIYGFGYLVFMLRAESDEKLPASVRSSMFARAIAFFSAGLVLLPIAILAWPALFQVAAAVCDLVLPNWVGTTMRILFPWALW